MLMLKKNFFALLCLVATIFPKAYAIGDDYYGKFTIEINHEDLSFSSLYEYFDGKGPNLGHDDDPQTWIPKTDKKIINTCEFKFDSKYCQMKTYNHSIRSYVMKTESNITDTLEFVAKYNYVPTNENLTLVAVEGETGDTIIVKSVKSTTDEAKIKFFVDNKYVNKIITIDLKCFGDLPNYIPGSTVEYFTINPIVEGLGDSHKVAFYISTWTGSWPLFKVPNKIKRFYEKISNGTGVYFGFDQDACLYTYSISDLFGGLVPQSDSKYVKDNCYSVFYSRFGDEYYSEPYNLHLTPASNFLGKNYHIKTTAYVSKFDEVKKNLTSTLVGLTDFGDGHLYTRELNDGETFFDLWIIDDATNDTLQFMKSENGEINFKLDDFCEMGKLIRLEYECYGKFPSSSTAEDLFFTPLIVNMPTNYKIAYDLMPIYLYKDYGSYGSNKVISRFEDDGFVNVYSINGHLLKANIKKEFSLDGLKNGIYIINGKKFIVNK